MLLNLLFPPADLRPRLQGNDCVVIDAVDYHYKLIEKNSYCLVDQSRYLWGWYVVEAGIASALPVDGLELVFTGWFGKHYSVCLPYTPAGIAKRFFYLPFMAKELKISLSIDVGEGDIQHLLIKPVLPSFAKQRLLKRVKQRRRETVDNVSGISHSATKQLLEYYDQTFEPADADKRYIQWQTSIEKPWLFALTESQHIESHDSHQHQRFKWGFIALASAFDSADLERFIQSLTDQIYDRWCLFIIDDGGVDSSVKHHVAEFDEHVEVVALLDGQGIYDTVQHCMAMIPCDYVCLINQAFVLPAYALDVLNNELAKQPDTKLIYAHHDELDNDGRRCNPFFKPEWDSILLTSQHYLRGLTVFNLKWLQGLSIPHSLQQLANDGALALSYMYLLLASRQLDNNVLAVPWVLCHLLPLSTEHAKALQDCEYRALKGVSLLDSEVKSVDYTDVARVFRLRYRVPEPMPWVTLIIPTRDAVDILKACINSILQYTDYENFDILVINNQSCEADTLAYFALLDSELCVTVLDYDKPFNYSAINNWAARQAKGDVLGFINNDVEAFDADWLNEMVSQLYRPNVGCVGAKLYYPDDRIQHAGIVLDASGVPEHKYRFFARDSAGEQGLLYSVQSVPAVTAAVMLVKADDFWLVEGFNEVDLPIAYNDVDVCFKLVGEGFMVVWSPFVELLHYESVSRGRDDVGERGERLLGEREYLVNTWKEKTLPNI